MSNSDPTPLPRGREPLPEPTAKWTDVTKRQPYFPSETVYTQFGYLWARHLLISDYTRASALREIVAIDHKISKQWLSPVAYWNPEEDGIYRVCIDPLTGKVEVVCLGIDHAAGQIEGTYTGVSALPDWIQDRIAGLMMMSHAPPTTKVEGVGQRIDANTFWVMPS